MTKQETIENAYRLLKMMEKVTGYDPGEAFYRGVAESLSAMDDAERDEAFIKITTIVTEAVDKAAADIAEIRKESLQDDERAERQRDIEEVSGVLNF